MDMDRAQREGFHFGAKLVRGAYMYLERAVAEKKNIVSPIWDTIEQTHLCYNRYETRVSLTFHSAMCYTFLSEAMQCLLPDLHKSQSKIHLDRLKERDVSHRSEKESCQICRKLSSP